MINQVIANGLTDRAMAAYYRSHGGNGSLMQPGGVEPIEHSGKWYIRLTNIRGILAVYRIREVNGQPMLKRLVRWPAEIEK